MPLVKIIRAVTYRAAQVLGEENHIGTLRPGSDADIAIFKKKNVNTMMQDRLGNQLKLSTLLVPQCTLLKGKVAYRQIDF